MENIEDKFNDQDQELAGINDFNDEYAPYENAHPPKREYPYLNFIDFEKYGVVIDNE